MAEAVLYAEARMGELIKGLPKPKFDKQLNGSLRGTTETLPEGINKKQSHYARQLADNQDVVEQVIAKVELIKGIPDFHSSGKGTIKRKELPKNINKKQSHYARQLADNQDVVSNY